MRGENLLPKRPRRLLDNDLEHSEESGYHAKRIRQKGECLSGAGRPVGELTR